MPRIKLSDETLTGLAFFSPLVDKLEFLQGSKEVESREVIARLHEILTSVLVDILEDDATLLNRIIEKRVMPVFETALELHNEGIPVAEAATAAHRLKRRL